MFTIDYYRRCHWCNKQLSGKQQRFCSKGCKQAHHRAREKYVTEVARQGKRAGRNGYARGGKAKKKKLTKT